jgi:hypothetical protein
MYNQMTDRFGLIQTEIVKATPLFGRTISAMNGYSLEVFHGQIPIGSVRTRGSVSASNTGRESEKMRVNNGDIIYKVNIVRVPIPIVGSFMTRDKYVRIYDITVDLVVSNPVLFVQGYQLGKDPIKLAIEKIKSSLQDYASRTEHDKLVGFNRPRDVWNNDLHVDIGMMVMQISWHDLREDPKRDEAASIQRDAENKKKSITTQDEIQKLADTFERERDTLKRERERGEKRKQNEFEREEEMLRHVHDIHYKLRETAAQELTDILRERIRYTFERDGSINEVAEDSLKLLNAFHESLHKGSVVDSILSNGSSENVKGTSPDADTISRDEDTTIEHDPTTDPLNVPPDMSDLSGTKQKEAGKE